MSVPKFCDIDKLAKDLLTEDYPLEPKLALKSTAKNGLNLKVDLNKANDAVSGTLKCKLAHSSGIVLEEKWTTSNDVTTEVSAENKLAQGTKVTLKSLFSPKAGPKNLQGTVEYNAHNVNAEVNVDHCFDKKPTSIGVSALAAYGNFRVGGCARVPLHNVQAIESQTVGVQFIQRDLAVTSTVTNFAKVEGSIFHDVRPNLTAALRFAWDKNTNENPSLEVGGKLNLQPDSFIKAKVNTQQQLTLSYTQPLQQGVVLTLGTQLLPSKAGDAAFTGRVGFSLNLS